MITHTSDTCPLCKQRNSIITDFQNGELACTNCGYVLEDHIIDEGYEGRNFSNEVPGAGGKAQSRVGGPINPYLDDFNLSTVIVSKKGVLSKWKQRSISTGGRTLYRIFKRAEELAQKLDLPQSIVEKSKDLLVNVEKNKKLKGRSLDCIIASVFFIACRSCNSPRTIKDIVQSLQLDRKDVAKCFNSIKSLVAGASSECLITTNVVGLVTLYCNKLSIPNHVKKAACEIAEDVCKKEIIAGRNPSTVSTASIYFATKLLQYAGTTKKDISAQSKTTESTISSAYQQILCHKDTIVPPYLKDKIGNLDL